MRLKLTLAIAAAVLAVWWAASLGSGKEMPQAPNITIIQNGKPVSLADFKGKVVLIDFWGTWCGPCRMSIPAIQRLYNEYRSRGFEVIGVAMEHDDGSQVPGFVKQMGMTYPVGMPTSRDAVEAYGASSLPFMALVDKNGRIRWSFTGYSESVDAELAGQIEGLVRE